MIKSLNILVIAIIFNTASYGQTSVIKNVKLEAKIISLEKAGWNAWKNNNAAWFQTNTTEKFLSITAEGISNKEQVVKSTPVDCNVQSVSLDNFKFIILNEKTVVLTYTVVQDGECGGKKLDKHIRASVTYVKEAGKWLEAVYMETPVAQ